MHSTGPAAYAKTLLHALSTSQVAGITAHTRTTTVNKATYKNKGE